MGTEQTANSYLGTKTGTEVDRMERFFQAFEYLSNHPIFQTEPGGERQLSASQARYLALGYETVTVETDPTVDF